DPNPCPPTGCVCTFSFHDCPDDTSVQCYADVPAAASVTATENCNGGPEHAVVVTYQGQTESSSGSKCGNTIMRIWTAIDDCQVTYTCSQVITVNDTTAPVLSGCPAATASYQCLADVPAAATVTATDNCDV